MERRYTEKELQEIMKIKEQYESNRRDHFIDGKASLLKASELIKEKESKKQQKSH